MKLEQFSNMVREVRSLLRCGWKLYKVRITLFKDGQYIVLGKEGR